jgi:hypothetical protein
VVEEPVRGRENEVPCTDAPSSGSLPDPESVPAPLAAVELVELEVDEDELELDDDELDDDELDDDDELEVDELLELDDDEDEDEDELLELDDDEDDELLELDDELELDDDDEEEEPSPGGGAAMTVQVTAAGWSVAAAVSSSWTFQSLSSCVADAGPLVQAMPTLKVPAGIWPGSYTPRLKAGMLTIGPGPPAVVALAVWASTNPVPVAS